MAFGWLQSALLVGVLPLICGEIRHTPAMPPVTRVVVTKSARTLELYSGDRVVLTYAVAVGKGGAGPKRRAGDLVTPVGHYHVVRHAPSHLHIFLELDYPNAEDKARFDRLKASGELPKSATIGNDIGIHGPPPDQRPFKKASYQSHGCVVLEKSEIDVIAALVADGTDVDIVD